MLRLCFSWWFHIFSNTVSSSSGFSSLYTSTVQCDLSGPPMPMQCSCATLVYQHLIFLLLTFYLLLFLSVFLYLLLPLLPSLAQGSLMERTPEDFEPEELNGSSLSPFNLWILSVIRNPTSTRFPLFGSLDTLLYDLIALTPGLAFFLTMTCMLVVASSFLSGPIFL